MSLWTKEQTDFLINNLHLTYEEIGQIIGKSKSQTGSRASRLGLKRPTCSPQEWTLDGNCYKLDIVSKVYGAKTVYISLDKIEIVSKYRWHISNSRRDKFYVESYSHGKKTKLHQLVFNTKHVDHIDGNEYNNRTENLRICNQSQNMMNSTKRKGCSSIYKGVFFDKRRKNKKWIAHIRLNTKLILLGSFETEIEAAKIYNEKAKELFGEFAKLNQIEENSWNES